MFLLRKSILQTYLIILISTVSFAQKLNIDTVKAYPLDTGKMWTFDYPPVEYLKTNYDFTPDQEWFDHARLSALRFGGGCSSSFVSADGLIMTNHHCGEWTLPIIAEDGEDFTQTGFYAKTLEEERKVPRLNVQQLVLMKDVTDEIHEAINNGKTEEEKIESRENKIKELEDKYSSETGLRCRITTFYNGGKYSLYGYKVFDDIRIVFIPEPNIGYFGGDYDNFTYPRYAMDCAYFRAYENGTPVKTENYLKFSSEGIHENEVIFTVGNPGRTSRLNTIAQIEYLRDVSYRNALFLYDSFYKTAERLQKEYPDRFDDFEKIKARLGNSQKVYLGRMQGLMNDYLIARKKAWEENLKEKIKSNEELNDKYGHAWDEIAKIRTQLKDIDQKIAAYGLRRYFSSEYFLIADKLIHYAEQLNLPEDKRDEEYKSGVIENTKSKIFPADFDQLIENEKLALQIDYIFLNIGFDNRFINNLFQSKVGKDAVPKILSKSKINTKEKVDELLNESPENILNLDDPFIQYLLKYKDELAELRKKSKELQDLEVVYEDMLGRMMFEVYGTSIPPDANGTLRLSDGVLKGFDYNGTAAPIKTTFYGMYDRYFSNDGKYPWDLPERWQNPPAEFDKSVQFDFCSTNDIVGGNSGSAVINKKGEVVGLAFDGNFKSNIGNIIFLPDENRCVSVSVLGMLEALEHIYKADRLVSELKNSKIE